jgi:hypothetical protein
MPQRAEQAANIQMNTGFGEMGAAGAMLKHAFHDAVYPFARMDHFNHTEQEF